jgi:hypothetical protein
MRTHGGKFCELVGEMGDETAMLVLMEEISNPDANVSGWLSHALVELRSRVSVAE